MSTNRKGSNWILVGMTGFVTFALAKMDKGERLKFALRLASGKGAFAVSKTAKFPPLQRLWTYFFARIASGAGSSSHHSKQKNPIRTARARIGFWSPTCNFIRTRNVRKEHGF